jgi:acyl carrier protein
MDRIYTILAELRPEFNYRESENFVEDGLLDSFDMISLVSTLEGEYGILIDALDIVPENFCSAEAIAGLIRKSGGVV